jgi:hypothetical protein
MRQVHIGRSAFSLWLLPNTVKQRNLSEEWWVGQCKIQRAYLAQDLC